MTRQIAASDVCAVVLAGGRGERMGGIDKGLQLFRGQTLAWHALDRLRRQTLGCPGQLLINANRNPEVYRQHGVAVVSDSVQGFAGPLAGVLTALQHGSTTQSYLLTVPCDSPLFPLDLLQRLAQALQDQSADIAMAVAPEASAEGAMSLRRQPVFCLYRRALLPSLAGFLATGQRKIDAWTSSHACVDVPFDRPSDDPRAFANANTLAELQALEQP